LRRVTGYLTSDYNRFNKGKFNEVNERIKHSLYES
jgi:anaerobic ribonucleoside-triphosphate reductase